jgi:hypothetical protein
MLVERMQHFVFPPAITAEPSIGLKLQVDLDAPFRLMGVVIWNLGVPQSTGTEGQIAIRFARPDGRFIQRQMISSNLVAPGNQYNETGMSTNKCLTATIHPGVLYPAGSVIAIDVLGLPTGISDPTGVIIIFVGCNIYQEGQVWNPQYPAKWTARPYLDYVQVQNVPIPGGFPSLNNPFTAQADSDFVWQAGVSTDFSLSETVASLLVADIVFEELFFKLTAVTPGVAGNSISFEVIYTGAANVAYNLSIVGPVITVTASTDSLGVSMHLNTLIANLQASPTFNALVTIGPPIGGLLSSVGAFPATFLSGGSGGGSGEALAQLVDLGVIVRDPAYKAYSNTYVPVGLLWPFLSAEAPGWLYPEIYVPRLGQLYFDFNYLYPGFVPAASPVTITLGLKGMKVYPQNG